MSLSLRIMDAFRHCVEALEHMGFSLTEESPTDEFVEEMEFAGKRGPSPSLSWKHSDLSTETNFWLALRYDGRLVGTASGRKDTVSEGDFPDFIERSLNRQWCTEADSRVSVVLPKTYDLICGDVIYMGDFFFHKEFTGCPEKTFSFSNAANAFAFAKWPQANLLYAHLRLADALEKAAIFGFTSEMLFNVSKWENPPHYRSFDECFCTLTRSNFEFNVTSMNSKLLRALPRRRPRSETEQAK